MDKLYGKFIWIMTGILFALAVSMMLISGTFHTDRFYDVGAVHDVSQNELKTNVNDTMYYDMEKQAWVVSSETATKHIFLSSSKWKYLYMPMSKISSGSFDARIDCYVDFEVVYQMNATLSEGENLLALPGIEFNRLDIVIENQPGLVFSIDDVQFRETMPVYSRDSFIKSFLGLAVAFFLLTGIIYRCIKNKIKKVSWYAPVHGLQTIFLYVGKAGEIFANRLVEPKRRIVRRGLFCFLLLLSQVNFVMLYYYEEQVYRYFVLVCVVILLLIAFLCWEKPLGYLNWNNKLVASWMGLWIFSMISDFMVDKQYSYMGYIMIFGFGFLFFMWGNMEHREELLLDFIRGIEWSFLPNVVFCYIFRPHMPGYRYLGGASKPGFFAMYLLFVVMALLADMRFAEKGKRPALGNVVRFLALGACLDFIWKTQTIAAIIPAAGVILLYSFKFWLNRHEVKILGFALCLFALGLGWTMNGYCVYHIPRTLNTEIKFRDDLYLDSVKEHPFVVDIRAAEPGNDNRILYKLKTSASLEELLTGRTLYWKAHIRDLNLWGHEKRARFWGSRRYPHNGVIAMMHRYGIFAAVPYILFIIYFIGYSCRYFKRHLREDKYAFFVLANMSCCLGLMLIENQELPFSWVFWYSMYIVMGVLFDDERAIESN